MKGRKVKDTRDLFCYAGVVEPFSEDRTCDEAIGVDLATFIAGALDEAGFAPGKPLDIQYAWELWPTVDGFTVQTAVGYVGDTTAASPRQWLITNDLKVGLFERLFRSSSVDAKVSGMRKLSRILHSALTSDGRFTSIRWHCPATFDQAGAEERDRPS